MAAKQPSQEQCDEKSLLASTPYQVSFATWYPAWGGYQGVSRVDFDPTTSSEEGYPGCFSVANWHDGEYPIMDEDGVPSEIHCCSAMDYVQFGLDVLERQIAHQKDVHGAPVKLPPEFVQEAIKRILALPVQGAGH